MKFKNIRGMLATQNEEIDIQVKPSTRSETIPLGDYTEGRKEDCRESET